jgi:pimeloyl-ACP methyl ester carboxylesterase
MEKQLGIRTKDGKIIRGILRGPVSKPVIVLVHGLAGDMNQAMHYNAARYFEQHGFSSLRFNLYDWHKDARKLHQCTFSTHGDDIDTVLAYLKSRRAKQIFIAGHSYGFPSILHAKRQSFKAVASWDGSLLPRNHADTPQKSIKPKGCLIDFGYSVVVGERMARDSKKIDTIELLQHFEQPISFITVDDDLDGNLSGGREMHEAFKGKKELVIIKGAHHNFSEEGKQEQLYAAAVRWFTRFI